MSPRSPVIVQREPSKFPSVTVEPPLTRRGTPLLVWGSFSPFLASSAPKDGPNHHRTQNHAIGGDPSPSLKRQGAIKARTTPYGKISIPRKDQTFGRETLKHNSQPNPLTDSPELAQPKPVRPRTNFFKERLAFFDGKLAPEGPLSHSMSGTPNSAASSLASTKAQYARSAGSERWDEYLARRSLGLPAKYNAPGMSYRFCGCSDCVWAKTSECSSVR